MPAATVPSLSRRLPIRNDTGELGRFNHFLKLLVGRVDCCEVMNNKGREVADCGIRSGRFSFFSCCHFIEIKKWRSLWSAIAWYRFGSPFRFSEIDREMPLRFSFRSVHESEMTTKAVTKLPHSKGSAIPILHQKFCILFIRVLF
jgi:hypothetical protein